MIIGHATLNSSPALDLDLDLDLGLDYFSVDFRAAVTDQESCLDDIAKQSAIMTPNKAAYIGLVLLFCLPVPPCRVVLKDHSGTQVFVGGIVGAVEGLLWFYLVKNYIAIRFPPPGEKWLGFIEDNWHGSRLKEKTELNESLLAFDHFEEETPRNKNLATRDFNPGHSAM